MLYSRLRWLARRRGWMSRRRCCCSATCNVTICVNGCGGLAVVGASVTIKSGSTVIATGTTAGALGCVTLAIPSAGSYTIVIVATGFPTNTSTHSLTCGGSIGISLTTAGAGYHCCSNCALPLSDTIYFTYAGNIYTLTWDVASSAWLSGVNIPSTNVCDASGNCSGGTTAGCRITVSCPDATGVYTVTFAWGGDTCPSGVFDHCCLSSSPYGSASLCNLGTTYSASGSCSGGSVSFSGTFPSSVTCAGCSVEIFTIVPGGGGAFSGSS